MLGVASLSVGRRISTIPNLRSSDPTRCRGTTVLDRFCHGEAAMEMSAFMQLLRAAPASGSPAGDFLPPMDPERLSARISKQEPDRRGKVERAY
jgi:hypothetical protein